MRYLETRRRATIACMAVVLLVADRAVAQFDGTPSRLTEATEAEHSILVELQLAPASLSEVEDLKKMLRAESPSIRLVVDSRPAERNVALVTVWPNATYDRVERVRWMLKKWGVPRVNLRLAPVPHTTPWRSGIVVSPDNIDVTLLIKSDADRDTYQDKVNRIATALGNEVKTISLAKAQGQQDAIAARVTAGGNAKYERIARVLKTLRNHGIAEVLLVKRDDPQVGQLSSLVAADSRRDLASLRKSVEREFELRQAQQRQELARLKERLARIERLIEEREKNRERIIERRVEELRNPALRWDATAH